MECEVDQCGVVPSAGTLVDPVVAWRHPASLKLFRVPMRGTIKNYRNGDWSEWRETNGKRGRGLAGALMTPPTTTGIAALGTRAGTMDVHNGRGGRNEENLKTRLKTTTLPGTGLWHALQSGQMVRRRRTCSHAWGIQSSALGLHCSHGNCGLYFSTRSPYYRSLRMCVKQLFAGLHWGRVDISNPPIQPQLALLHWAQRAGVMNAWSGGVLEAGGGSAEGEGDFGETNQGFCCSTRELG